MVSLQNSLLKIKSNFVIVFENYKIEVKNFGSTLFFLIYSSVVSVKVLNGMGWVVHGNGVCPLSDSPKAISH